ncbi:L,D-transpeptidase family protein [Pseudalkalibacillus sp. R45]|uniref:L,D-transpeptidase family protein n=1 Tax=Pseudalkalibacillus sp. R45 TaxID=3457433 RepID=UPI003FCD4EA1
MSKLRKNKGIVTICTLIIAFFVNIPAADAGYNNQFNHLHNKQLVVVSAASKGSHKAKLETFELINGQWKAVFPTMDAVVGYNGISGKTKEGDGKTPEGVYEFGTAFGSQSKPSNISLPYRKTTDYDYWVDDPNSPDYNKWIHYTGNPYSRWGSFERMKQPLYKYGIVIKYNEDPIIPGKGSAIFMHVWKGSNSPTAGCVAVSESNLLRMMKWLDPDKNPGIIMADHGDIDKVLNEHLYNEAIESVRAAQINSNLLKPYYTSDVQSIEDISVSEGFLKQYNIVKNLNEKTRQAIHPLNASQQSFLKEQLLRPDQIRLQAARFIDSVKVGDDLLGWRNQLHYFIDAQTINDEMVSTYHNLSYVIRKAERVLSKAYGNEYRSLLNDKFITPAKITKEVVIYEVSRYELHKEISTHIEAGELELAGDKIAMLDRLEKRAKEIKEAGNELYPGKYPSLPEIEATLMNEKEQIIKDYENATNTNR